MLKKQFNPCNNLNSNFSFSQHKQAAPMQKHEVQTYLKSSETYVHSPIVTKGLYNSNFMFKSNQSARCCDIRLSPRQMQTIDSSIRDMSPLNREIYMSTQKTIEPVSDAQLPQKAQSSEQNTFGYGWGVTNPRLRNSHQIRSMRE